MSISSADLSLDDSLSELEGVCKYARSKIELQRFVHVKQIASTARSAGVAAALEHLLPLVADVVQDDAYLVRQHLALQVAPLAAFLAKRGGDAGYAVALRTLLPIMRTLLMDAIVDVRTAATEGMVQFAQVLLPADREDVLTIALKLAHETESEDLRVTGASLLNTLAPAMGKDLCCQFIAAEIVSLAQDPKFRVRKAVSLSMHQACQAVGDEAAVKRLLPSFRKLARDEKFAVRRACAESIVAISRAVTTHERLNTLVGCMVALVADDSKWVRAAALKHLGAFLITLPAVAVDPNVVVDPRLHEEKQRAANAKTCAPLLRCFAGMAFPTAAAATAAGVGRVAGGRIGGAENRGGKRAQARAEARAAAAAAAAAPEQHSGSDPMSAQHCAFALPAVMQWLGATRWPELRPSFIALCNHPSSAVRRISATSLHEVARVLGRHLGCDAVDEQILDAFTTCVRENSAPISLSNFSHSLLSLTHTTRCSPSSLPLLPWCRFLKDESEVRLGVLKHLAAILVQFSPEWREAQLHVLLDVYEAGAERYYDWRCRRMLATQLPDLCSLFSSAATFSVVRKLLTHMLHDPVHAVRFECCAGIAPLLRRTGADPAWQREILMQLQCLATSSDFRERQLYCRLIIALSFEDARQRRRNDDLLSIALHWLYLPLLSLAHDPVTVVRLSLIRCIAECSAPPPP